MIKMRKRLYKIFRLYKLKLMNYFNIEFNMLCNQMLQQKMEFFINYSKKISKSMNKLIFHLMFINYIANWWSLMHFYLD